MLAGARRGGGSSTTPAAQPSAPGSRRPARRAGQLVYTEKAGVNTIVVDSTDNLRGVLGQPRVSLTPLLRADVHHPAEPLRPLATARAPTRATSRSTTGGQAGCLRGQADSVTTPARSSCSARTVNDGVRANAAGLASLAEEAGGTVVLDSRAVSHPAYPDAVTRPPAWASRWTAQPLGCLHPGALGPVTFLIAHEWHAPVAGAVPRHGARARRDDGARVYSTLRWT